MSARIVVFRPQPSMNIVVQHGVVYRLTTEAELLGLLSALATLDALRKAA